MPFSQVAPVIFFTLAVIAVLPAAPVPETETLFEQEKALYDKLVQPTTYEQEEELYESLVQEDVASAQSAATESNKKAAKKAVKKAAKKAAKATDNGEADTGIWKKVAPSDDKAEENHKKAITAEGARRKDSVEAPLKISVATHEAEAKETKVQAKIHEADNKKVETHQKLAAAASEAVVKEEKDMATKENEKEIESTHKALHPGNAQTEQEIATFDKAIAENVVGSSPFPADSGKMMTGKEPGNVDVKTTPPEAAKNAKKVAKKESKTAPKKKAPAKTFELVSLPSPEEFGSAQVPPTAEEAVFSNMRAEENTMQDQMTKLYNEELAA